MTPRLAIIYPCHHSMAYLCLRSVLALRAQTCEPGLFEVVIGADGGDPTGEFTEIARRAQADGPGQAFSCSVVSSPRPRGEVPHRNHARNAGWRASRAPITFILDADFMLPPHAVSHILEEHDKFIGTKLPAMFSPCLASVGGTSIEDWPARTASWVESGDPAEFVRLLEGQGIVDDAYSGYARKYTGPGHAASMSLPGLPEGMPILWRGVIEALGGFNEDFGEWGGDKEEFVDRIRGLTKWRLCQLRLLTSVMALHQPHHKDPDAWSKEGRQRCRIREIRKRQVLRQALWWRAQVKEARAAFPAALEAAGRR